MNERRRKKKEESAKRPQTGRENAKGSVILVATIK